MFQIRVVTQFEERCEAERSGRMRAKASTTLSLTYFVEEIQTDSLAIFSRNTDFLAMNVARERMDGSRKRMDGSRERMHGSRERMDGSRERMDGSRGRMDGSRELFLK